MVKDLSQIIDRVVLEVSADDAGVRIDHFLGDRVGWRSRTELQERVKAGTVTVNGQSVKPSQRLKKGDVVTIHVKARDLPDQDPGRIDVEIVHEDDAICVVNKQPGLMVHPAGLHVYDTLMNALWLRYKSLPGAVEPHVVHRLDKDTSGVIVVARTPEIKKTLQQHFEDRGPKKTYLAICRGRVGFDRESVDLPLDRDPKADIKLKMTVREGGLPSLTEFETVERFAEFTLMRCSPHTGRQHQIRVHLAAIGHPILTDPLYGDPRSMGFADGTELLRRQALHAESLTFDHPVTKERVRFAAPLAADMQRVLDALRRGDVIVPLIDHQSAKWRTR